MLQHRCAVALAPHHHAQLLQPSLHPQGEPPAESRRQERQGETGCVCEAHTLGKGHTAMRSCFSPSLHPPGKAKSKGQRREEPCDWLCVCLGKGSTLCAQLAAAPHCTLEGRSRAKGRKRGRSRGGQYSNRVYSAVSGELHLERGVCPGCLTWMRSLRALGHTAGLDGCTQEHALGAPPRRGSQSSASPFPLVLPLPLPLPSPSASPYPSPPL